MSQGFKVSMIALLFISLSIPAATALLLMLFRASLNQSSARWVACCGSMAALLFSVLLLVQYRAQVVNPLESEPQSNLKNAVLNNS